MKRSAWQITLAISLVIISAAIYYEQVELFHAPRDTSGACPGQTASISPATSSGRSSASLPKGFPLGNT